MAYSITAKYNRRGSPTRGLHNTGGVARYSFSLRKAVSVEDGCCPFKIVFDEDLYVVFDEDFYVHFMYFCFALSMS